MPRMWSFCDTRSLIPLTLKLPQRNATPTPPAISRVWYHFQYCHCPLYLGLQLYVLCKATNPDPFFATPPNTHHHSARAALPSEPDYESTNVLKAFGRGAVPT